MPSFDSIEDLTKFMNAVRQHEAKLAEHMLPWQKELKPGDYFIRIWETEQGQMLTIYGEILEPHKDDEPISENLLLMRGYSTVCPEGEIGLQHRVYCAAHISEKEFLWFKEQGWPDISRHAQKADVTGDRWKEWDGKLIDGGPLNE